MNLSRVAALTSTLFMTGNLRGDTQEVLPQARVSEGVSCQQEALLAQVQTRLPKGTASDRIEFVVAAGPNRIQNLPTAIRLANQVAESTSEQVSLVLRVDEGELPEGWREKGRIDPQDLRWDFVLERLMYDKSGITVAQLLATVRSEVGQALVVQAMGTSYTEVVDSILETKANALVFLAHNWPLQERLTLAAENTVSVGPMSEHLRGVQVLCHGNTLDADFAKEAASYALDGSTSLVGGHDAVVDTSRGGHRWARIKKWAGF